VDTRFLLNKEVAAGGLGLDHKTIDNIFKLCDAALVPQQPGSSAPVNPATSVAPAAGLDKIRGLYEKEATRDIPYDLSAALASGTVKKPESPLSLEKGETAEEKLLAVPVISPLAATPVASTSQVPISVSPVAVSTAVPVAGAAAASAVPAKAVSGLSEAMSDILPPRPLPKIERPPEKKPNLITKIFNKDTAKPEPVAPQAIPPVKTVPAVPTVKPSIASRRAAAAQGAPISHSRPIITGVKNAPLVMGPVEELRYLDLVNFRRFGSSPAEAAAKVEAKIKLLEKDGYDKMVQGVTAWRECPVDILYLKMAGEALTKEITLKQCADNYRAKNDNNFLIWEELEAIIALNSRLMF
jgi:hypothetical protein